MPRSHPPSLTTLARRTLLEECRVAPGEKIVVAVSGGGDSSALLSVLSLLAPKMGFSLLAHGVDHGLRRDAGRELDLAEILAGRLGIPFTRDRLTVRPGGNLQARAREARRESLEAARLRASATRIATAHHADDRAETVLLRLLHGARAEGLAVLGAVEGVWIRPLVRARKADVLLHIERHCIAYAEDPSNRDPRFERTRVRLEVLPLLATLSPRIVEHLAALADDLAWALGSPRTPEASESSESGRDLPLRNAQIAALRRALALGRPARIRLAGGGRGGRGAGPGLDLVVEHAPSPGKPRKAGKARKAD